MLLVLLARLRDFISPNAVGRFAVCSGSQAAIRVHRESPCDSHVSFTTLQLRSAGLLAARLCLLCSSLHSHQLVSHVAARQSSGFKTVTDFCSRHSPCTETAFLKARTQKDLASG